MVTALDPGSRGPTLARHGEIHLPAVDIVSYASEIRDDDGFIGDRASHTAFGAILENWRKAFRKFGGDPLADLPPEGSATPVLDEYLARGDLATLGLIHSAIEDFAQNLARVIKRFQKTKAWAEAQRIAIGGGFRKPRVGQMAIGRAAALLKADAVATEIRLIAHEPDEAGLIGCLHLVPSWIFEGHDCILGVDIGGTNIRAGIVEANAATTRDLSRARVLTAKIWRHADDGPNRTEAIDGLVEMLEQLIARADKDKLRLAPFIGVGCPGVIEEDGTISKGAQNLPGRWEGKRFNLPQALRRAFPRIAGHDVVVQLHNDAVVHGLSAVPQMRDVQQWGVLTIGTGLGNACFATRTPAAAEKDKAKPAKA